MDKQRKITTFLTSGVALSIPEKQVYDCLKDKSDLNKADIGEIARNVKMSDLQVKAAIFLLYQKGLIQSEDIVDDFYL